MTCVSTVLCQQESYVYKRFACDFILRSFISMLTYLDVPDSEIIIYHL